MTALPWHRLRHLLRNGLARAPGAGAPGAYGSPGAGSGSASAAIDLPRIAAALTGRYDIQHLLGSGGMAEVYCAVDRRHDRQVAIKVLRPDVLQGGGTDRFLHEIRIAAGLRHPHILPVYDSGSADGIAFYVMPVEMASLRDRLARDRIVPLDEALRLTGEILSALDYAHEQGVVHRDVKPENVLLSHGHAVIADFGVARAVHAAGSTRLTHAGSPIGSPAYMSPEQIDAEIDADGRSDLYSAALVLYEMLTGTMGFTGPNAQALLIRRIQQPVAELHFPETVPPHVQAAIHEALAVNPDRRPPTGAALLEQLGAGGKSPPLSITITPRPRDQPTIRSIGVLPFSNLGGAPADDYLSDGLTDEIINALAQFRELRVPARTSVFALKDSTLDVRAIAAKLGVETVLEGSIRRAGDRLRITVQLVTAADGYHVWSERYDRGAGDVFAVQDEITRAIVDRLRISIAAHKDAVARPPTTDVEAYHLYLKGRHLWNRRTKESLEQAVRYFEDAIGRDPQFALAYSGLADAQLVRGAYNFIPQCYAMPTVRVAVERALALDDSVAEAHASLGIVHRWERDWKQEDAAYRRAIELNPSYPTAHQWYATHLASRGRFEEAVTQIRLAEELDPLSHAISVTAAVVLFLAKRPEEALTQLDRTIDLEPNFASAHAWFGGVYAQLGRHDDAERSIRRAVELAPDNPNIPSALAYSYAVRGMREEALATVEAARQRGAGAWRAFVHAALGDFDAAFECLDRAIEMPDSWDLVIYVKVHPWLEPLHNDPRFRELLQRLDIPD